MHNEISFIHGTVTFLSPTLTCIQPEDCLFKNRSMLLMII